MAITLHVIDSNVFIGAYNPMDVYHKEAAIIVKKVDEGVVGEVMVTDYVFDEVLTFIRKKAGFKASLEALNALLGSKFLKIAKIDEDVFQASFIIFERYRQLSFTDAVTVS